TRKLDIFTAITLSYAINKDKQKYYKALDEVSHPKNMGDMTLFCQVMLEILKSGQELLIEDLSINVVKSEKILNYVEQLEWNVENKGVLGTLLLIYVFSGREQILSN